MKALCPLIYIHAINFNGGESGEWGENTEKRGKYMFFNNFSVFFFCIKIPTPKGIRNHTPRYGGARLRG